MQVMLRFIDESHLVVVIKLHKYKKLNRQISVFLINFIVSSNSFRLIKLSIWFIYLFIYFDLANYLFGFIYLFIYLVYQIISVFLILFSFI